jgi:carnitine 3-dehydrogenase
LGPPIESWWRDLGSVTLTEKLNQAIAQGVVEELGGTDLGDLTSRRDDALLTLLQTQGHLRP